LSTDQPNDRNYTSGILFCGEINILSF